MKNSIGFMIVAILFLLASQGAKTEGAAIAYGLGSIVYAIISVLNFIINK